MTRWLLPMTYALHAAAATFRQMAGEVWPHKWPHKNLILFAGADGATFLMDSYSISDGQPFLGFEVSSSEKGAAIDVLAGRHNSRQPALDFLRGAHGRNVLASFTALATTSVPWRLNFAVFGTLTLTIKGKRFQCKDMRIGEGHYPFFNNWWIGAPHCRRSKNWWARVFLHLNETVGSLVCPACGLAFHAVYGIRPNHFAVTVLNESEANNVQDVALQLPETVDSARYEPGARNGPARGDEGTLAGFAMWAVAAVTALCSSALLYRYFAGTVDKDDQEFEYEQLDSDARLLSTEE